MSDATCEIRAALDRFVSGYNRNDEGAMRSIFSATFIDMSAGEPTRYGEAAVNLMLRRAALAHEHSVPHLEINVQEVRVFDDWGYQHGDLVVTLSRRDTGEISHIRQRFLEIWHREDGGWKSAVGMDNEPVSYEPE